MTLECSMHIIVWQNHYLLLNFSQAWFHHNRKNTQCYWKCHQFATKSFDISICSTIKIFGEIFMGLMQLIFFSLEFIQTSMHIMVWQNLYHLVHFPQAWFHHNRKSTPCYWKCHQFAIKYLDIIICSTSKIMEKFLQVSSS